MALKDVEVLYHELYAFGGAAAVLEALRPVFYCFFLTMKGVELITQTVFLGCRKYKEVM